GVLEHIDTVGRGDGDRTARSSLSDDHRDDGHAEAQAAVGRAGDGFSLAALLGADTGISAGGIDQAHHRQREAVGHVHESHRLAIALRPRHAEIVPDAALGVGALLVPKYHDRTAGQATDDAYTGMVLGKGAVARKRGEVLHETVDVMAEVRAIWVASDLRLLPRRKLGVGLLQGLTGLGLELGKLLLDRHRTLLSGKRLQLVNLAFKLGDRFFKIETGTHSVSICLRAISGLGARACQPETLEAVI